MRNKFILGGIIIFCIIIVGSCIKNETKNQEADLATQAAGGILFENKCLFCHNGLMAKAPKVDALKLLSKEAIVTSLQTGAMRLQGSTLSNEEHHQIASYLTQSNKSKDGLSIVSGMCDASKNEDLYPSNSNITDWGMGLKNQRFINSEKLQINAKNVSQLKLSWVFAFPNSSRARAQPTIAGNTLFTADQHGIIYALDRSTGCVRWTFQADAEVRSALTIGMDKNKRATKLYFSDFNAQVYALDLKTKKLLWKVKVDDHSAATITGSLSLYKDQLYVPVSSLEIVSAMDSTYQCCNFRGSVVSLNIENGLTNWKTYTIAKKPVQHGTNRNGVPNFAASGAPVWSRPTIDTFRQLLYVGTGENYSRPASKTSDAIMAMSLDNGQIQWAKQAIPKDAWNGACMIPNHPNCPEDNGPDADFGAPPMLIKYGEKDLIIAGQKSGTVYALDPDNDGEILWEKTVGRGGMMGGVHWGMATDGQTLFVPINDQGPTYPLHENIAPTPGLHALDLKDGTTLWSTIEKNRCDSVDWSCGPGISAAITATPEVIFTGAIDGVLKAYDVKDGKELWAFETMRDFDSVNGVKGFGGTIDSDGPIIVENQMFITSGYAKFNEKAGNIILAFELEK